MTDLKEENKKEQYKLKKKKNLKKRKEKSITNIFVKSLARKGIYVKNFK